MPAIPPLFTTSSHPITTTINVTASWRSLFWALLALAFNALLQPSSSPATLPRTSPLLPALSPPLLAADALLLLAKLSWCLLLRGLRPRAAAALVLSGRHGPGGGGPRWLRPVVFGLGALPQLIKLFAIRGIPVVQAWAACYLFAFVVVEALLQAAEGADHGEARRGDREAFAARFGAADRWVARLGLLGEMTGAVWALGVVLHAACETPSGGEPRASLKLLVIVGLVMSLAVPSVLFILYVNMFQTDSTVLESERGIYIIGSGVGCVLLGVCVFFLIGLPGSGFTATGGNFKKWGTVWASGGFHCFPLIIVFYSWVVQLRPLTNFLYHISPCFQIIILVDLILYFAYVYDPSSTVKATWIENLG